VDALEVLAFQHDRVTDAALPSSVAIDLDGLPAVREVE
jgi:hypothetical protein